MSSENSPTESDDSNPQSSTAAVDTANDSDEPPQPETQHNERSIRTHLEWGAVAGLGLIALVAVFRFYFAASRAISIWISSDFEPIFQAIFNIVILLFAVTGIIVFARRLR